jgi:hypothetical protein
MPSWGAAKNMKKMPKVLGHLLIRKAEGGGHIVEHHFTSMEHEPESHVFAAGEGKQMMAHVGEHMGADLSAEPEAEDLGKAEGSDKEQIDA